VLVDTEMVGDAELPGSDASNREIGGVHVRRAPVWTRNARGVAATGGRRGLCERPLSVVRMPRLRVQGVSASQRRYRPPGHATSVSDREMTACFEAGRIV